MIEMIGLLTVPYCGYAALNQNGWISINLLFILAAITFAGLGYAVANFLPVQRREKLKGLATYELVEAFITIAIVFILIVLTSFSCTVGASLSSQYTDYSSLFKMVDGYVTNLLFVNGLSLLTQIYSTSIQFSVIANVVYLILNQFQQLLGLASFWLVKDIVAINFSSNIDVLFGEYAGLFTGIYGGFLGLSFAALFIIALSLPIIEAVSLTVLLPISIVFRALAFTGPQLRKVSNQMLAVAVGLYFVLPLTLAFNIYVANCLNIGQGIQAVPCAGYPFALSGYSVNSLSSSLFSSNCPPSVTTCSVQSSALPGFASSLLSTGIPWSFYSSAGVGGVGQFFTAMFDAPAVAANYAQSTAAYLFLSIVLIAIDMAITVGFMSGLANALDYVNSLFTSGGFWGD